MHKVIERIFIKFFVPLFLLWLPFVVPQYHVNFDTASILTVVSLLFAILAGFFIASTTTNYFSLQGLLSQEGANLIAILNLSKFFKSGSEKIREVIDKYLITGLDYELPAYIEGTEKEFKELTIAVDELDYADMTNDNFSSDIQGTKNELFGIRQGIMLTARKIIGTYHWLILILLALLNNILLFLLRDGGWLSSVIVGVLLVATYFILVLLYELDSGLFMEEQLSFETAEKVFEGIDKLRYYPEYLIKEKRVKGLVVPYRLGVYKDYPRSMEKEIRVIDI